MAEFQHKHVVITGGTSGIGKATARLFVKQGASVLITGLEPRRGEAAISDLPAGPGRVRFCRADMQDPVQVAAMFGEFDRTFGALDILFNNAGVNCPGPLEMLSEAQWDACMDTNLKGAFLAMREAVPRLRQRGGGVIVNNASNAGLVGRAADPAYCASKAGLIMLTRSAALAYAQDRIRVNVVCPGPVSDTRLMDTYLQQAADPVTAAAAALAAAPLAAAYGRMITPDEVAAAVLYLCSDAACMVTGAVLTIDGGKSAGLPRTT